MLTVGLHLLAGFMLFLQVIYWAIIIDVLLSWLTLLGIHVVIWPLKAITQPLYDLTSRIFPTRIGMMDFTPLILILVINILTSLVIPSIIQSIQ